MEGSTDDRGFDPRGAAGGTTLGRSPTDEAREERLRVARTRFDGLGVFVFPPAPAFSERQPASCQGLDDHNIPTDGAPALL